MRVAVTGGSGRIGRWVVADLVERGHECLNLDKIPHPWGTGRSLLVDLRFPGEIYQALSAFNPDVVIHLAAWSADGFVTAAKTYSDNCVATFNVLQAAADLGVGRVIWASSHHIYGTASLPPAYLPLDEDHPIRPVGPYGLSKVAGEEAAEYFTRTSGVAVLSFRVFGVRGPEEMDQAVEETLARPGENLRLMWSRLDARDAAGYFSNAVEADGVEPGPYHIASRRTVLDEPTASLVSRHFGTSTEVRLPLEGCSSPISTEKAKRAFKYTPRFDWSVDRRFPL